jgi:hypothetical protein
VAAPETGKPIFPAQIRLQTASQGGYLGTIEGYLGSYYRLKETQQEFVIFMIMSRPGDLIPAACTDHSGSIIGQVISKPT